MCLLWSLYDIYFYQSGILSLLLAARGRCGLYKRSQTVTNRKARGTQTASEEEEQEEQEEVEVEPQI